MTDRTKWRDIERAHVDPNFYTWRDDGTCVGEQLLAGELPSIAHEMERMP
jgi:hypothetical protein